MKKISKISAIIISFIMLLCIFAVTAFAVGEPIGEADMPSPELSNEMFDEMMGLWGIIMIASLFSSLFLPALVVMIIFIVKNNDVKRDLRQYERLFGSVEAQNNFTTYQQPPATSYNSFTPPEMNTKVSQNNEGGNM